MTFISLNNRVAVVTGAAQGIGLAVTDRLASAGASVAIVDVNAGGAREAADTLSARGLSARPFACDVSDLPSVKGMFQAVLEQYGDIDILVNNAGVGGAFASIQDQTVEEWHRVIGIDLTGVFYACRAVIPRMIARGYGRIINVASTAGKDGSPLMVPYSAAKGGVIALTKALAKEVGKHNIMVNAITPSIIDTPMLRNEMPPDTAKMLIQRTPVGRFGRPRRSGGHGALARVRGLLLHDRLGLRRIRRPFYVLMGAF